MKKKIQEKKEEELNELKDFPIDIKRDIIDIINDTPTIVCLGEREFVVKNMRYYSIFRICKLCLAMREKDEDIDNDNKIITALCTDLDAMSEVMAIVLCNHLFTADDVNTFDDVAGCISKNDKMVAIMKMKVMNSTFDVNQWAAIVIAAIKSIDLSGFFLLKKSVSTLMDSIMTRKKKSVEIASQFMEALSLRTQQTS